MKEKLRSYEFWVSVFSAVLMVLQTLSTQINIPHMTEVMTAFLGALCVVGILKKAPSSDEDGQSNLSNTADTKDAQDENTQEKSSQEKDEDK